ncbi:hypothetical protein Tco_1513444, partial [Tanacetum coccineum]
SCGIEPLSLFALKSTWARLNMEPRDEGMGPVNWWVRLTMEPSDEGIRRKLVMIKIEMKQILQVPYLRWDSTREIVSRKIKFY